MYVLQVFKVRPTQTHYLHDYCDGQMFKEHPLFSSDAHALQLILYTDEVETANPLGSYRGQHKLSMHSCGTAIKCTTCACVNLLPFLCSPLLLHNWKYSSYVAFNTKMHTADCMCDNTNPTKIWL